MDDRPAELSAYHFHWVDYIAFVLMLMFSAGCGVYYGWIYPRPAATAARQQGPHKKEKLESNNFGSAKMNEYLLGSSQLKIFPVAMSLVASYISGVTVLGTPSEVYNQGTQYWLIVVSVCLMGITVSKVYLPVFFALKVGSSYEYLKLRFNCTVRTMASVMFVFDELMFLPLIVYVPALAFNQVTGVNIKLIAVIVLVTTVFYTLAGGMRAVVATDALQIVVMFIAVLLIAIIGTVYMNGASNVFKIANEGGRIIFDNFTPSLYERQSFWAVLIGGYFYWTGFNSVNQTMVQRYLSLPDIRKSQIAIIIFIVGIVLSISICVYTGLLIYAEYHDCDPKSAGLIKADDQLYPLYVMQSVGHLHGIPGLFIAGVFGAALSSLSVVLNSTAAVIHEDIIKGCCGIKFDETRAFWFVKGVILLLGVITLGLMMVVEKLGSVLGVATSLTAIASGTTFGIFTLGMLNPWCTSKGAVVGGIFGALTSGTVSLGSQIVVAAKLVTVKTLPISVEGCKNLSLSLLITPDDIIENDESNVFPLFRLSFHWIPVIGIMSVIIAGSLTSYFTKPRILQDIDPELMSPVIHRFLPAKCFENYGKVSAVYHGEQNMPLANGTSQEQSKMLTDFKK